MFRLIENANLIKFTYSVFCAVLLNHDDIAGYVIFCHLLYYNELLKFQSKTVVKLQTILYLSSLDMSQVPKCVRHKLNF